METKVYLREVKGRATLVVFNDEIIERGVKYLIGTIQCLHSPWFGKWLGCQYREADINELIEKGKMVRIQ